MKFNSTDAWLLQSIYPSQGSGSASLRDVIAFADYVNHAIMTFGELSTSLSKLMSISLVIAEPDGFNTSATFHQWWSKKFKEKKLVQPLKEMIEIEKYLNATFDGANEEVSAGNVSLEDYQEAVDSYTKG